MATPVGTIEGETVDVSTLVAYIQCPEPLNPSENFLLSVTLPAGSPLQVFAEVVWSSSTGLESKNGPPGMGVRFLW
jgi:Tfp pilus assembly protein PilZ